MRDAVALAVVEFLRGAKRQGLNRVDGAFCFARGGDVVECTVRGAEAEHFAGGPADGDEVGSGGRGCYVAGEGGDAGGVEERGDFGVWVEGVGGDEGRRGPDGGVEVGVGRGEGEPGVAACGWGFVGDGEGAGGGCVFEFG